MIPLLLSLLFGYTFLPADDPNFLDSLGPCLSDPNCIEALTEYLNPNYVPEKKEPDAQWTDVYALQLTAFCEDWLMNEVVLYDRTFPFDPNYVDFYAGSICQKLKGIGWKYSLTVKRTEKDLYMIRIKVTRPRPRKNMNDWAEFTRNWMKGE